MLSQQPNHPISQMHEDTAWQLAKLAATYSEGVFAVIPAEDRAALIDLSYRIPRYIDVLRRAEEAARRLRDAVAREQRPCLKLVRDE